MKLPIFGVQIQPGRCLMCTFSCVYVSFVRLARYNTENERTSDRAKEERVSENMTGDLPWSAFIMRHR